MAQPSERERFLAIYERESATTQKVLAAFPADKASFTPHEKSSSAQRLLFTFVVEEKMILKALRHEPMNLGSGMPATASTWDALIAEFAADREEILKLLRSSGDEIMDGTVPFFVAPKQTGDYPRAEFVAFMMHDQIHHRGQMTVYLRMVGGKVPSIYGPTADEPWN
jgi:uncharacterized damage-inducible protein DinB